MSIRRIHRCDSCAREAFKGSDGRFRRGTDGVLETLINWSELSHPNIERHLHFCSYECLEWWASMNIRQIALAEKELSQATDPDRNQA